MMIRAAEVDRHPTVNQRHSVVHKDRLHGVLRGLGSAVTESRTPDMGRSGDGHSFVTVGLFGVSVSCYRGYS